MSLETATYISQLDAANPLGSDPIASGDDHLRLIKSTLKNTFPAIAGPVAATHTQIDTAVAQAAAALPKAGGTMTGALVLSGNPSAALEAAPKQYVDAIVAAAMLAIYPIGSVYSNATNATNPATLLGFGTWVAFGAGRVPVGYDATNTNFNLGEKTGGSADAIVVSHSHTITDPGHTHSYVNSNFASGVTPQYAYSGNTYNSDNSVNPATTGITVNSTGSSGTNANLQPYITVYMWKRTA